MRIAVTGASGFLARHIVPEIRRAGHEPVLLLREGRTPLPGMEDLRVARFDLCQPPSDAFDVLGSPDLLIHLAWGGLPNYRSLHHIEEELPAQYRFLRGLIDAGLKHVVVSGTCFEYGMQSGELDESTHPRPANPYGFAKDSLRVMLEFLRTSRAFHLTWARLFYLHGDGQAENSILPQLRRAVENRDEVFNMSGGEQLRDYLAAPRFAADFVRLALTHQHHGIVNVCSGQPISVRTLVEREIADHGWDIRLNRGHYPYPDHEPMAFWGSRAKLDRLLASP